MKVIVKDYLNVRVGKPSVNAPTYQFLAPGSVIETDGQLHKGDPYDGIDTWVKDEAGNYYWSGGVIRNSITSTRLGVFNYNSIINLPVEVRETKGKGIIIGVADTGCFRHPAFVDRILKGYNAIESKEGDYDDESYESHGTFVSGIISANYFDKAEMIGVAPEAQILVAKVSKQKTLNDNLAILRGLNWLIDQKPDIINCSFDFSPQNQKDEFQNCFKRALDNNIMLVAAGQDDEGLLNNFGIYFPSSDSNFISIGSLNAQVFSNNESKHFIPKIKYIIEDFHFKSTDIYGSYDTMHGSSFASAYVSGALALLLAHSKKKSNPVNELDLSSAFLTKPGQLSGNPVIFKNPYYQNIVV